MKSWVGSFWMWFFICEMNFNLSHHGCHGLCHKQRSFPTQEMLQRSRSQWLHNVNDWFCQSFLGQMDVSISLGSGTNNGEKMGKQQHLNLSSSFGPLKKYGMAKKECHFKSFQHDISYKRISWKTLDSLNDTNTNEPHQLDDDSDSNEFWQFSELLNIKTSQDMSFGQHLMQHFHHNALKVRTTSFLGNVIHFNKSSICRRYEKHHHPFYHKPLHHIMDKTMALFPDIVRCLEPNMLEIPTTDVSCATPAWTSLTDLDSQQIYTRYR